LSHPPSPARADAGRPTDSPPTEPPPNYKWKVLCTVVFGIFMIILDTTIVNVAFQTLRQEFGSSLNDSQWIISVYVLALGVSTPLSGFLADRYGSKRIYLSGLGLFVLGSLLCGLAPSLGLLIAARAIQGVGGGLAMPLGTALLLQAFPVNEQGMALGAFGIVALVAPALGPILGGWLVDQNMWRVIFFVNPPIGVIGILLGMRFLRESTSPRRPAFDLAGIVTEVIGFGAILYAASVAAVLGWSSPATLTWFAVGVVGLAAFGAIELLVAKSPLLDLRLFGNRTFLTASLLGYVSTVALFGAEFLMPVYLQSLRGRTALQTGLILLPMAITGGVFIILAGRIYDRIGPRPLLVVGFGILLVNTWQLSLIQADTPVQWILFLLTLRGIALGLTVQTTFVTALSVVPRSDLPRGSSLTNATRFVVQSLGVAVLATVLASAVSPEVQALQQQFTAGQHVANAHPTGICEPISAAWAWTEDAGNGSLFSGIAHATTIQEPGLTLSPSIDLVQRACQENIAGFERTYQITFYAALIALLLGLLVPGWPGRWAGRQMTGDPSPMAH
jgi:EmrB/QacA subfamily drug resistance transporter